MHVRACPKKLPSRIEPATIVPFYYTSDTLGYLPLPHFEFTILFDFSEIIKPETKSYWYLDIYPVNGYPDSKLSALSLLVCIRVFRKKFLCQNQSHRVAKDDKYCLKEHVKILTLYPNGK